MTCTSQLYNLLSLTCPYVASNGAFPPWRGLSVPCRAGPVFGCASTRPSSGPEVLFHLFSGPTKSWFYRGPTNRAEFAKLERASLARGLQLQQDEHI